MDDNIFNVCNSSVDLYDLWHNRLSHVNYESVKLMCRNNMIRMCEFDKYI